MNPKGGPLEPTAAAGGAGKAELEAMFDPASGDWQGRLSYIVETMREMSSIDDPQKMVRYYASRISPSLASDGMVAVSRRGMPPGKYRVTRSSRFKGEVDPWANPEKLPVLSGGVLGMLLYGDQPMALADFAPDPSDPAYEFISGMRSLVAIPQYDGGIGQNMVVHMWAKPEGIDPRRLPEMVWLSNLFGRATSNLVLSRKLATAYQSLDRELKAVGDIQRSLLPLDLPSTEKLEWATHYATSASAGGDYYDFFELPGGRLGMLLADVSGHGTPAAVVMAVLHALAHQLSDSSEPRAVLSHLNRELCRRYTANGMFATAFYSVYEPETGKLTFSSAGHNPPRLRVGFAGEGGPVLSLDQAQNLPLGVIDDAEFTEASVTLEPGDAVVYYTDGITEAFNPKREQFGVDRLDEVIQRPHTSAAAFMGAILREVAEFTEGFPAADDQTLLIAAARQ
jgi:sigma-B regulation protein RsbU (phosphoserine phosphatase)